MGGNPRDRSRLEAASDERLVALARAGSAAAFEAIFARYHSTLLAYCRHILRSPEDGEDAVQQTFLSAHAALLASDAPVHLRGWLFAIARNRCITTLRCRREEPTRDTFEVATASLAEQVEQREDVRHLLDDLAGLPQSQRTALVLAEVAALSHRDIAQVVGGSQARVTALVFRARASLIDARDARQADCGEIRAQIAELPSGVRPHRWVRRHLAVCDGCRGFDGRSGRGRAVAMALPVAPGALEPVAGASGVLATAAKGIALKLAIGGAVAGAVAGGAVVVVTERHPRRPHATVPAATSRDPGAPRRVPVSRRAALPGPSAAAGPAVRAIGQAARRSRLNARALRAGSRPRSVAAPLHEPAATAEPQGAVAGPRTARVDAPAASAPGAARPRAPPRGGRRVRPAQPRPQSADPRSSGQHPRGVARGLAHTQAGSRKPEGHAKPAEPRPAAEPAPRPPTPLSRAAGGGHRGAAPRAEGSPGGALGAQRAGSH